MPRLSVLLPVRNAGPYLDASLAPQSCTDFEVVAVEAAGPAAGALVRWEPPLVLVFGAASAQLR